MKKKIKKRRGGRKPGTWTLVKPEEILAYRKAQSLSRLGFAKLVGVSSTTVQNWETGKGPAMPKVQERIVAVLRTDAGSQPSRGRKATKVEQHATNGQRHGGYDSTVEATGRIVAAFLGSMKIKREELRGVIQDVRAALG